MLYYLLFQIYQTESHIQLFINYTHSNIVIASTKPSNVTVPPGCNKPFLTLFTTFKNDAYKNQSNVNVVRNWALLLPCIQPILFTQKGLSDLNVVQLAHSLGWMTVDVKNESPSRVPVLKYLFSEAYSLVRSEFYGYSNGDILYDTSLLETLQAINRSKKTTTDYRCLVIGSRKNFAIGNLTLYKTEDVEYQIDNLKPFQASAEDYFFISDDNFPWVKIPEVVVGRPGNI